ncbi:MAG: Crp/Fnr family transcriptional regulator [Pyrinomonadaceae bacterium]|nr:Crp/Fnr family transcriptional regulator [Pyrinomonadaceae bacterium]
MSEVSRRLSNRILSVLPKEDYERIAPHLEYVEMKQGEVLFHSEEHIQYAYFPYRGTVSLVAVMAKGSQVEVGTVGREGMVGLPIVMGTDSVPLMAVTQIPGSGARIRAGRFKDALRQSEDMYKNFLCYGQALFVQTAITAGCNRLHYVEGRLAKWLLTCRDRAESDELQLTQEFLAVLLGVRRAGVTTAANKLKEDGLIDYARGRIQILDAEKLEAVACECYQAVKTEFNRLLG